MATIRPASQVTSAHLRGWAVVAALAGSLALAPGACWWSVSRRPEASVCLLVVIGSGAARVCKLELILTNDVAVDLQEVGRGS